MAAEVERVAWFWPREQVCYMAQRTLELLVPKIAESVITQVETGNLGYAGGVASNIKVNRLIRTNPRVKRLFVCPHMGDGGLALGAAWAASARRGVVPRPLDHLFLGSGSNGQQDGIDQQVIAALEGHSIPVQRCMDIVANTARLIADGKVVMWYQGAMELGPRALGHRSILARADSTRIKDDLNLRLKRRVWFQPFCPSMLTSEARRLLSDFRGPDENPFMTCGFLVRPEHLATLQGVIGPDGSCRPQMVRDDDRTLYTELLKELKRVTGVGVLLNTSFNLHGEPLVNTVSEAVNTWIRSGVDYLVIEDMLLRKPDLPP
jgi:carbamoyltransferase